MSHLNDTQNYSSTPHSSRYPWPGHDRESWSIGFYRGASPFTLQPVNEVSNPILTCYDVTDLDASFVADPFLIRAADLYYLFMEIKGWESRKGVIGLATSKDGLHWQYEKIVLEEDFHLSYPYVFEVAGTYYMIPETLDVEAIRLYQAKEFPYRWEYCGDLLAGKHADPSVFFHDKKWWMFTCPKPYEHDTLNLYFSDQLSGPWQSHPKNPIISQDATSARPAGRVIKFQKHWVRFAQDCQALYGQQVHAFKIKKMTTTAYEEVAYTFNPILTYSGEGWNGQRMHHLDTCQDTDDSWLAVVDGYFLNKAPKVT